MSGLTHCEKCGQPLGMNRFGMCESCEKEQKQRKEKINMSKTYDFIGLLTAIKKGKIQERTKINR